MTDIIFKKLAQEIGEEKILFNEPMKKHTTFKIGGPADIFIEPDSREDALKVIKLLRENNVSYFVMGNGSNILVSDKGIRGAVIKISQKMDEVLVKEDTIIAKSGAKLSRIAKAALNSSLKGFEFAAGIPGTLGGAIFMNAGAYGGEMKDVIESVTYIDIDALEIKTVLNCECDFGYRSSIFSKNNTIITEAKIKLKKGEQSEIKAKMDELSFKRCEKQPLEKPSAGSTFKRPDGYFAGALIQQSGLMGYKIGGAMVSEKHAGFVVNEAGATAKDVLDLIEHIKKTVLERFNVELEPEVKLIGEF